MNRVHTDERIAYQTLSSFSDLLPPRCHALEDMNKEGNHRTSVKYRSSLSIISSLVPATFYLLSSGMVATYNFFQIVTVIVQEGIYWDWREGNQIATANPKLDLKTQPLREGFQQAAVGKVNKMGSYPCKVSCTDWSTELGRMVHHNNKKSPNLVFGPQTSFLF